jgi:hypothetical protein
MSIAKVTELVFCLCKLHNFCLDERENRSVIVPHCFEGDRMSIYDTSQDSDSPPGQLLDGGHHFDDVQSGKKGATRFANGSSTSDKTPRDSMLELILNGNWKRQVRSSRKRVRNDDST